MSTSRISPPPFREVRFLLADADYVGDSPCHSFIGFGPGSLGIPEAVYPKLRPSLTAETRHALIDRLASRYGLPLNELVTEQHRWSGSYLHLAHSLQWHLEGLTEYATQEGAQVVNFDFSVVGIGDNKRSVTPLKMPDGCVAVDMSKQKPLSAKIVQQVRSAKVLHLILPRIGEEDYISVLASADVPPLIRGITTAIELMLRIQILKSLAPHLTISERM